QDGRLLYRGSTIVTGHSGTFEPLEGVIPDGLEPADVTFLNFNGASARFFLPDQPGYVWDGREWLLDPYFEVFADTTGQVFGIAIDRGWPLEADGTRPAPNAYLTATSAFGLNIVIPDSNDDGLPERVRTGQPGAEFMFAQFGADTGDGQVPGPGSIYKVDGETRTVSLFANVTSNGVPNSGPGLGNIAFDKKHDQLFVSDRDTGMIHRFDLDGAELGVFDHGVDGRMNEGLPPVDFDPMNRLDIQDPGFFTEDPTTWAYANPARLIWGLAVHRGRLYYAVAEGPQIWSVGIDKATGDLLPDARWELDADPDGPGFEISDIVFNSDGAMILAQRGSQDGAYDYTSLMLPQQARLLRYWREDPDDPTTTGRWQPLAEEYAVGFLPDYRNSSGGVDLNYGYDETGNMDFSQCEGSIWTSGDNLRVNDELTDFLASTGNELVHGIQGSPADAVRPMNEPPYASYFVDYDKLYEDPQASGHIGDVEVLRRCPKAGKIPPPPPPPPPPQEVCPPWTDGIWPNCVEVKYCPPGTFGNWPNCRRVKVCPPRTFGNWPYCVRVKVCPRGTIGRWPNCRRVKFCPPRTFGNWPFCRPIKICPPNTVGKWPNCRRIKRCPPRTFGKWPNCRPVKICPPNTVGKWPNCRRIKRCPPRTFGKWPNCRPVKICPPNTVGKWPNCRRIKRCPPRTFGKWPNCRPVKICPPNTVGKWPNCRRIKRCPPR
ncbi:MAG: hypothetical protein ACE5DK_11785, partial [Paracoccaceae bacterium]